MTVVSEIKGNEINIKGYSKQTVRELAKRIKAQDQFEQEKTFHFLLSEEQAVFLRALNGVTQTPLAALKVSEVVQDPATKDYSLLYRSTPDERDFLEGEIANALAGLGAAPLQVS